MIKLFRNIVDRLRGAWFGFSQGHQQLTTCALTGVLNRDTILAVGAQEVGRAKRHGRWLGVAVIDLDGFKPINDEYGHEMGDAVLAEVGRVLRASVRTEDFVGRIGGDEFVLIFPEASANALHVAVRRAFALIREQLEVVGTSYGVHSQMLGKSSPETFDDFKKAADAKMYEDKRAKKAQR